MDTTVVEGEMCYPTDPGLLVDRVRAITRTIPQLIKAGAEGVGKFREVSRSVHGRLGAIGRGLKQDEGSNRGWWLTRARPRLR